MASMSISVARSGQHLGFLDAYGGGGASCARTGGGRGLSRAHAPGGEDQGGAQGRAGRERELAEIERQLAEIDAAKLRPGEEEELESRAAILENAENIRAALSQAYQLTYDGAGSAQELLSRAAVAVEKIAGIDARYAALSDRLREVFIARRMRAMRCAMPWRMWRATPRRWKRSTPGWMSFTA